jgi:hypothetical protein
MIKKIKNKIYQYNINMSFYSSGQIKSDILEPSVFVAGEGSGRAEFRIHGSVLPSIKLLNVGRNGSVGASYPDSVGALGSIRNISLLDGRTVLTELRNFNEWLAYNTLVNTNQHNTDLDRFLKRHRIGYTNNFDATSNTQNQRKSDIKNPITMALDVNYSTASAKQAFYDLREVFDMLRVVPILSDKVFKQLRLVIEFETSANRIFYQNVDNVATNNNRPLLAVDRVMDDRQANAMIGQIGALSWEDVEMDRVNIEAVVAGADQTKNRKVLGFNGKTLGRLVIKKAFQDKTKYVNANASVGYGVYSSLHGFNESFNVLVNGRAIYPRGKLEGSNRILAHLVDTQGDVNYHESSHINLHAGYDTLTVAGNQSESGRQDYFGTSINQKINELQIEFSRTGKTDGTASSKYKDALELVLIGYVGKQLQVGNGGYLISYV